MKAEELMVGDWVYNAHHKKNIRVTAYDFFCHGHRKDGSQFITSLCQPALGRDLVPIPLTPEILEENGFKKSESDTLSQTWAWAEKSEKIYNRWVQITFYNEPINGVSYLTKIETCSSKGDGVNYLHSCDIESVHQLQHALRLCGIDKEIVI